MAAIILSLQRLDHGLPQEIGGGVSLRLLLLASSDQVRLHPLKQLRHYLVLCGPATAGGFATTPISGSRHQREFLVRVFYMPL